MTLCSQPQRAAVRPRVFNAEGESLSLEEELRPLVEAGVAGAMALSGPSGSGKSTALRHLAAVFADDQPIQDVDRPNFLFLEKTPTGRLASRCLLCAGELEIPGWLAAASVDGLVVCVLPEWRRKVARPVPWLKVYEMAPWGRDEWIEYLLARHSDQCASVLARLSADPDLLDCGAPGLCQVVLEQLAQDESLANVRTALLRFMAGQAKDAAVLETILEGCWIALPGGAKTDSARLFCECHDAGLSRAAVRLLFYPVVRLHLATEFLVINLKRGTAADHLSRALSRELVAATARRIVGHRQILQQLRDLLTGPDATHPMVASLLHVAESGWVPGGVRNLAGAYLAGAAWPEVRLRRPCLDRADLSGAYLARARLSRCQATGANLARAQLSRAVFTSLKAEGANFAHADLSFARARRASLKGANLTGAVLDDADLSGCLLTEADLTGASLQGANLTGACLLKANINAADFRGANLNKALLMGLRLRDAAFAGACFRAARIGECDLEYMDLPGADFEGAELRGAQLTGAILSEANFAGTCLCETGLADVNWESACLRGADLSGASFHMGSSRSGLVNSPIACEGSRTGFYTDDFEDQNFKSPEEIRKANLRGADLRGARLGNVDFYLVDLRDALFDPGQEENLRRMGAILNDWKR